MGGWGGGGSAQRGLIPDFSQGWDEILHNQALKAYVLYRPILPETSLVSVCESGSGGVVTAAI